MFYYFNVWASIFNNIKVPLKVSINWFIKHLLICSSCEVGIGIGNKRKTTNCTLQETHRNRSSQGPSPRTTLRQEQRVKQSLYLTPQGSHKATSGLSVFFRQLCKIREPKGNRELMACITEDWPQARERQTEGETIYLLPFSKVFNEKFF